MVCGAKSAPLVNSMTTNESGDIGIVNEHLHAHISHHRMDKNYVDDISSIFIEIGTNCGNIESEMLEEEFKVEVSIVTTSYEEKVGTSHEVMHELATTKLGTNKVTNVGASDFVDPTIKFVDVNFDEEKFTRYEWFHMMQQNI